ncbi:hypothetical protein QBC35DRAFT_455155 [Podospora australis]|uniref:SnoaL-like domain-containing protein n=1 Tax=Podospora australis TaxID=1536484 RepID=A0AAN6WQM1_9PEZI|nr:hypothetical protein QBC35DRAFT_455155 [Podospora australis]
MMIICSLTASAIALFTLAPLIYAQTLASITNYLRRVEAVREVKNLQRIFAQYAAHGLWTNMFTLFTPQGVLLWGGGNTTTTNDVLSCDDGVFANGQDAIARWLETDAGLMDGHRPGSLHALINDQPVITLSDDGQTAQGRWHLLRVMGDGSGSLTVQADLMENQYTRNKQGQWRIALLSYCPVISGDNTGNWLQSTENNTLPHYTPDQVGTPVTGNSTSTEELDLEELTYRTSQLNDEDEIRNLVQAGAFYVDRRMWTDAVALFTEDGAISVDNRTSRPGFTSVRGRLEGAIGPEGLTRGSLYDPPTFQIIVEVNPDGTQGIARGVELGIIGRHNDAQNQTSALWQFRVIRHSYRKDAVTGIWRIAGLTFTSLGIANFSSGRVTNTTTSTNPGLIPPFLNVLAPKPATRRPADWLPLFRSSLSSSSADDLSALSIRLGRSSALDETEHVSSAMGYSLNDRNCSSVASLYSTKASAQLQGSGITAGFYLTPARIQTACEATTQDNVAFTWRTQPVIVPSNDGRSVTTRSQTFQLSTTFELTGWINHGQFVLEPLDPNNATSITRRKVWSSTTDEPYWSLNGVAQSSPARLKTKRQAQPIIAPDITLTDPRLADRLRGFPGGPGPLVTWPDIQTTYFPYRNPVTGNLPSTLGGRVAYSPGCVPCKAIPAWSLASNGFQEAATGPTSLVATVGASFLTGIEVNVQVRAGPGR